MGTVLAELAELSEKCRKIFILTDRIAVYNDGIADGPIKAELRQQNARNTRTFVIFQRQVGTMDSGCTGLKVFWHAGSPGLHELVPEAMDAVRRGWRRGCSPS